MNGVMLRDEEGQPFVTSVMPTLRPNADPIAPACRAGRRLLICLVVVLCSAWMSEGDVGARRAPGPVGVPELVLTQGGAATCALVALPEAGKVARFAAEELQAHLTRATGARFEILEELPSSSPAILVGVLYHVNAGAVGAREQFRRGPQVFSAMARGLQDAKQE